MEVPSHAVHVDQSPFDPSHSFPNKYILRKNLATTTYFGLDTCDTIGSAPSIQKPFTTASRIRNSWDRNRNQNSLLLETLFRKVQKCSGLVTRSLLQEMLQVGMRDTSYLCAAWIPASMGSGEALLFYGYNFNLSEGNTYDHRSVKTGHPVRSAIHKH